MAHPLHGIRPEAEKVRRACAWDSGSDWALWKLARLEGGRLRIHPSAGDQGGPTFGAPLPLPDGRPPAAVREWAAAFPGWDPVRA